MIAIGIAAALAGGRLLGAYLYGVGTHDAAAIAAACVLGVTSLVAAYLAYGYALTGQFDVAVAEGQRAIEIDSTLVWSQTALLSAYRGAGRSADAIAFARRMMTQVDAPRRFGLAAYTLGRFGATSEAKKLIASLEAVPRDHTGGS